MNIVQQTSCELPFFRCSNAVKYVLFRSFCTPMYPSQLWCNFRKSCMQRLRMAYNFGCRVLCNLPWRASVSSRQVQCNIPTFVALLRKYTYLFLERCRKSNNIWLRALMQSDCLYSSPFFEHYNRILLCEWVIEHGCIRLIDGVSSHIAFAFYLYSTNVGISALLRSSFFNKCYVLSNFSVKNVSVTLWFCLQCSRKKCL